MKKTSMDSNDPSKQRKSVTFEDGKSPEHGKDRKVSVESRLSTSSNSVQVVQLKKKIPSKRSFKFQTNNWCMEKLCCGVTFESEEEVEYVDFKASKIRQMDEDELFQRLTLAVNEFSHRPNNFSIESEIQRYHKKLEIEQKQYEDSGKPTFKYKWFRKNQYLMPKKHPLYGTNYENQRKLEVRLEEFRFGTVFAHGEHRGEGRYSFEAKDAKYWRKDSQIFYANLALLSSVSNFLRFPLACYANGGFTFFILYCIMLAAVGQPLLFLEMILGQFSLDGPSGFARLHPYAKGIPYAIAFVCIVFGTSRSIYVAYSILYFVISPIASPGTCGWWRSSDTKCVPYKNFEDYGQVLKSERGKDNNTQSDEFGRLTAVEEVSVFSTEIFFREVMLSADWKSPDNNSYINWKLILAYIIMCILVLIPIHFNLSGRYMQKYLRASRSLSIMIFIILLHQIIFRDALSLTWAYFLTVDTQHVSALGIWSQAFEMVLSTLGIGFGFHWSISGNVSIDYSETYRMSWRMCGYAALFGLVSSLVLFCEIGIVGDISGDTSHYHVFYERTGISFVCFSGAMLKVGFGTVVFVVICFFIFVLYGMWSQIIVADIILRYIEHGHIIKGSKRIITERKKLTIAILIGIQFLVVLPYCFSHGNAVLAADNIFGGELAAYSILLIELVIVVWLYGFGKFLADVEIMTKRPLPAMFQIQIRYVVVPIILIFTIPLLVNVYLYPSLFPERSELGWLFYYGLAINFIPVLIMLLALPFEQAMRLYRRKVGPVPYIYSDPGKKAIEEMRALYPLVEPRFMAKVGAPSQQSNNRTIRSEIYHVVEHNMEFVHKGQDYVKNKFLELRRFKLNQARWIKLSLAVLNNIKVESMAGLVERLMLARKFHNNKWDVRFIDQALEQIVNLNFLSAMRQFQRMPMAEMLLYLCDEILSLTNFEIDTRPYNLFDLASSSSSSESSDDNKNYYNNNRTPGFSSSDSGSESRKPYMQIHNQLYGQLEKTPEECRTLLTIRLKRGLGLPHHREMNVLKFLRRERSRVSRQVCCWTQRVEYPVEHFIPSSISNKAGDKVCFTIFHAVVVKGEDHFVLKRLPVPKPAIVRVTPSFIYAQPGKDVSEKIAHIVTKRMHRNIARIMEKRDLKTLSKKKLKRHLWKVTDRIDDDVYDFLDRILTCVVIIVPEEDASKKVARKLYLTPRTRRKGKSRRQEIRLNEKSTESIGDYEITSYNALNLHQLKQEYWARLIEQNEASDIRYHDPDTESEASIDDGDVSDDAKSSSGSTSTISSGETEQSPSLTDDSSKVSAGSRKSSMATMFKSNYMLTNETLLRRDNRMLKIKQSGGLLSEEEKEQELKATLSAEKIKHVSARKWKHERDKAITEQKETVRFTNSELRLQTMVDETAGHVASKSMETKSMEVLKSKETKSNLSMRYAVSIESVQKLLTNVTEFNVDLSKEEILKMSGEQIQFMKMEEQLRNGSPDLLYLAYGKTLIVDLGAKVTLRAVHQSSRPQMTD